MSKYHHMKFHIYHIYSVREIAKQDFLFLFFFHAGPSGHQHWSLHRLTFFTPVKYMAKINWKMYKLSKLNEYNQHAKFDIYHIYGVRENRSVKRFCAQHWSLHRLAYFMWVNNQMFTLSEFSNKVNLDTWQGKKPSSFTVSEVLGIFIIRCWAEYLQLVIVCHWLYET